MLFLRNALPALLLRSIFGGRRQGELIMHKKILLYTWATCPFCIAAKQLLVEKNVAFEERQIDGDDAGWAQMQQRTNGATTVPQIIIGDHLVGGFSELRELEEAGRLDALIQA